jgi:hypothetical protein
MKNRSTVLVSILIAFVLLMITSCNLPSAEQDSFQTSVAGTIAAENAASPPEEAQDAQLPPPDIPIPTLTFTFSPTFTLSPTITASPTITLTPTLDKPMVSVSTSTNCRTGPGTIYDIIGVLMVGEQAEVVGKGEWGNYWIIKNPDGAGECWLWSNYATVTGPTDGMTVYSPPPTPTPAFDWAGTWTISSGPMGWNFPLTITTNGRDFTAITSFGALTINYTGTISDDYMSVNGTWVEDVDNTGSFNFYAVGTNQFNGNIDDGDFEEPRCGWRGGAGMPSPCHRP